MGILILVASGVMAVITGPLYRLGRFGAEATAEIVNMASVRDEADHARALKIRFTVPGRGEVIAESRAYLNADAPERSHVLVRYSARNPARVYIEGWDTPLRRLRLTLWAEAVPAAVGLGLLVAAVALIPTK